MKLETTEIKLICQQIADVYKNKMQDAEYDPKGELMNFKWVTEYKGDLFLLWFVLPEYWKYSEYGIPAGAYKQAPPKDRPPFNAIFKWMAFKKLVPSSKLSLQSNDYRFINAVRKKIARVGTQGKHLLRATIDETYNTLVDRLVEAITDELDKEIEKDIEQI